jgi:circadian clock protein KaiC
MAMTDQRGAEFVDTGVPGFDRILGGGLLRGGVYIVEGAPGSGKTILGNQMCFHRAGAGDSTLYVTLLAESHTRMISHLRGMRFFRPELTRTAISYTSAFKILESTGLDGLLRSIRDSIHQRDVSFVVLDGLVSVEEFAPSARDFKKFIHELQTITGMTNCTILMLSSTERAGGFRPEHTMVDGVIELADTVVGVQSQRSLIVRKMRGVRQLVGKHSMEISNAGIKVRPRIETLDRTNTWLERTALPRAAFGVVGLDQMLHGGLPGGSNTIALGPSGVGKTMLGLQFLTGGANHGHPGLYVGFSERPEHLLEKSRRLGLGLEERRDLVQLRWEAPIEGVVDAVVERVLADVEQYAIKRLCFDGLHAFRFHAEYPERTRAVFAALADELARRGVTTLFTLELPELLGKEIVVPIDGVSPIADNLVLMRHVEVRAQLHRLISILKMRDSAYEGGIREFKITERGIVVADTFESVEQMLTGAAHVVPE